MNLEELLAACREAAPTLDWYGCVYKAVTRCGRASLEVAYQNGQYVVKFLDTTLTAVYNKDLKEAIAKLKGKIPKDTIDEMTIVQMLFLAFGIEEPTKQQLTHKFNYGDKVKLIGNDTVYVVQRIIFGPELWYSLREFEYLRELYDIKEDQLEFYVCLFRDYLLETKLKVTDNFLAWRDPTYKDGCRLVCVSPNNPKAIDKVKKIYGDLSSWGISNISECLDLPFVDAD